MDRFTVVFWVGVLVVVALVTSLVWYPYFFVDVEPDGVELQETGVEHANGSTSGYAVVHNPTGDTVKAQVEVALYDGDARVTGWKTTRSERIGPGETVVLYRTWNTQSGWGTSDSGIATTLPDTACIKWTDSYWTVTDDTVRCV